MLNYLGCEKLQKIAFLNKTFAAVSRFMVKACRLMIMVTPSFARKHVLIITVSLDSAKYHDYTSPL